MARLTISTLVVAVTTFVVVSLCASSPTAPVFSAAQWTAEDPSAAATTYIPGAEQQAAAGETPAVKGWAPSRAVGGGKHPVRTESETREVMKSVAQDMNVDIDLEHIDDMAPLMKDLSTLIYHQSSSSEIARHRTLLDRSMGQRAHQKLLKKLMKYFPDDTPDQLEERLYRMQKMIQDFASKKPNASYMEVVNETAKRLDLKLEDVDMGQLQSHMKWMERVFQTLNPGALGTLNEQKAEEF